MKKTKETCPKCGCDLEEARREREQEIQRLINEGCEDLLRWPRGRTRWTRGIVGVVLGLFVSMLLLAIVISITDLLGIHDPFGEDKVNWFNITTQQLFIRILTVVLVTAPPVWFAWIFGKNAISKEERMLKKKFEKDITTQA